MEPPDGRENRLKAMDMMQAMFSMQAYLAQLRPPCGREIKCSVIQEQCGATALLAG